MNHGHELRAPDSRTAHDSSLDLSVLVSEMNIGPKWDPRRISHDTLLEPERAALLRPHVLEAIGLARRWGDSRLLSELGVTHEWPENTGELWLASDIPGFASALKGDRRRRTLRELIKLDPIAVLGAPADSFPLLVKLLLGGGRMSVQVHPDGPGARALGRGPRGKHEAWWVLAARPEAVIVRGLREDSDEAKVREEVERGCFQDRMNRFQPSPGQLYDIPPGTIHGCGDGLAILEVQETSDITFRLYDWGRPGTQLHLAEALQVSRLKAEPEFQPTSAFAGLPSNSRAPFAMRAHALKAGEFLPIGGSELAELAVSTRGRLLVESWGIEVAPFEALLWPAACPPGRILALDDLELLWTTPRT